MLKFHAQTDVGLKRKHNEDSLLAAEDSGVFVVADGVGGRKAGEIASAITVNTFQGFVSAFREKVEAYAKAPSRETKTEALKLLDQAANSASRRVYEAATATGRTQRSSSRSTVMVHLCRFAHRNVDRPDCVMR